MKTEKKLRNTHEGSIFYINGIYNAYEPYKFHYNLFALI